MQLQSLGADGRVSLAAVPSALALRVLGYTILCRRLFRAFLYSLYIVLKPKVLIDTVIWSLSNVASPAVFRCRCYKPRRQWSKEASLRYHTVVDI